MQVEALTLCEKLERAATRYPAGWQCITPNGIRAFRYSGFAHQRAFSSSGYRLCAAGDGTLKGSGRSIQGLHMRMRWSD